MALYLVEHIGEHEELLIPAVRASIIVEAVSRAEAVFAANREWESDVEPGEWYTATPVITIGGLGEVRVPA